MPLHADSEDSDQTGRMLRLIRDFAGRPCQFVGFVVLRLISVLCFLTQRQYILYRKKKKKTFSDSQIKIISGEGCGHLF